MERQDDGESSSLNIPYSTTKGSETEPWAQSTAAFLEYVRENHTVLRTQCRGYLRRPGRSRFEIAAAIYVDSLLEGLAGDQNLLAVETGSDETRLDRIAIATMAAEYVSSERLAVAPSSRAATQVQLGGLSASFSVHVELLREIWPAIRTTLFL